MMCKKADKYGLCVTNSDSDGDIEIFKRHRPNSNRRVNHVKINPIFHERGHEDLDRRSQSEGDLTADDINLRRYESLPRPKLQKVQTLERKFSSDSSLLDSDRHDSDVCSRRIGIANRYGSHRKHRGRHKYEVKKPKSSLGGSRTTTNDEDTGFGDYGQGYNTFSSDTTHKSYKHEVKRVRRKASRRAVIMDMTGSNTLDRMGGGTQVVDEEEIREHRMEYSSETDSHMEDLTSEPPIHLTTTIDLSDWSRSVEEVVITPANESRTRMSIQRKGIVGRVHSAKYKKFTQSSSSNDESVDSKPIKPILVSSSSCDDSSNTSRRKSCVSSGESKMVTFAEDTIFNEDKPKRYQKEKINLKDLYGGRIFSSSVIAKINPLFTDDDGGIDDDFCMTDDQKAERHNYPGSISSTSTLSAQTLDLNAPSYLTKYLSSLSRDGACSTISGESGNTPDIYIPLDIELDKMSRNDTYLSQDTLYGVPDGHDRLLRMTRKKERRIQIIKWIVIAVAFTVIVAGGISLVIYFSKDKMP
ncbi:hypothetical protein LOTGIDRAFT_162423 [Lottia gigantea]|uniref:Uncharacterized protein n=1 Tax=Lottia gigantea TaxID=225164 RepID=V4AGH9_LOTGI|nr:hypothetical protein LOTGIDRAFT_162423 [Lottia gigantea]ESO92521.1 hypothetical protein LOTGIDRAFT_162423 [Lottia gigantea]